MKDDAARLQPFEEAFQELRKWVDTNETQYAVLSAQREQLHGRYATAVKWVITQLVSFTWAECTHECPVDGQEQKVACYAAAL